MRNFKIYAILLVLFSLLFPAFFNTYLLHISIMILFYAYLGSCWAILGGYAGQLSLGHSAFFGIGAYTSTLLFLKWGVSPWIGMFLGAFLAMLAALFLGALTFRYGLRGVYFALITLAFSIVIKQIALNCEFTGGPIGLLVPLEGHSFFLFQFKDKIYYYYTILLFVFLIILINWLIEQSRIGSYLIAIREDEEAAESVGVDTRRYKLVAIGISGFMSAFAGTFYAQYLFYIEPELTLGIGLSIEIILAPIVGGAGTLFGPLVGSIIMGLLSDITRAAWGGGRTPRSASSHLWYHFNARGLVPTTRCRRIRTKCFKTKTVRW